jgi:hypothetical protein
MGSCENTPVHNPSTVPKLPPKYEIFMRLALVAPSPNTRAHGWHTRCNGGSSGNANVHHLLISGNASGSDPDATLVRALFKWLFGRLPRGE